MATRRSWHSGIWIVVFVLALPALADRGSIPFRPGVQVFEPVQRAMIAWNGTEEILLLSTDLHASEPTKVLEVLPLPAEPQVQRGDVAVFQRATALINRKLADDARTSDGKSGALGATSVPAGEVTFHEKIGAHDISVMRVRDAGGFVEWVNDTLRRAGVDNPSIPAPLTAVIEEYLRDGYGWFAFDVVELGVEPRTNDAIQYRFATESLYYPLRITRVERGETRIDLLVLTPKLLGNFPGLPVQQVRLAHRPIEISGSELAALSPEMHELLGERPTHQLRIWTIRGRLDAFSAHLLARR